VRHATDQWRSVHRVLLGEFEHPSGHADVLLRTTHVHVHVNPGTESETVMDEIISILALVCGGAIAVTGTSCTVWLMLAWTQHKANKLIRGDK